MKNGRNYWAGHVEAIKSQGVSTSAYARQHGISVAALYYWQRKLQAQVAPHSMALAAPKPQSKFVALHMSDAVAQITPSSKRIRPVRIALQNQRDDLLAFAGVLDDKLEAIAADNELPMYLVRQACVLQRKPETSPAYWEGWCRLCPQMGHKCHAVFEAVMQAMVQTPRCSSMVENLNSRLRNYFTLRRQLGAKYLGLLQFFLNHRTFRVLPVSLHEIA